MANPYDDNRFVDFNASRERNGLGTVPYNQFQTIQSTAKNMATEKPFKPVGGTVNDAINAQTGQPVTPSVSLPKPGNQPYPIPLGAGMTANILDTRNNLVNQLGHVAQNSAQSLQNQLPVLGGVASGIAGKTLTDAAKTGAANVSNFATNYPQAFADKAVELGGNVLNKAGNNFAESVGNVRALQKQEGLPGMLTGVAGETMRLGGSVLGSIFNGNGTQFKEPGQDAQQQPVQGPSQQTPAALGQAPNPMLEAIQKSNASREAGANRFQEQTGYKPGSQPFAGQQPLEMTQQAWGDRRAQEDGSATSSGKGGDFRYLRNENGDLVKQNMADGSVTPVQDRVTHMNPDKNAQGLGGTSEFWKNNGYPGGAAQYRQEGTAKKQQAELYQNINALQQVTLDPNVRQDIRENAQQMLGQYLNYANGLGGHQVQQGANDINREQLGLTRETNQANREAAAAERAYVHQKDERQYGLDQQKFQLDQQKTNKTEYGSRTNADGENEPYPKTGPAAERAYAINQRYKQRKADPAYLQALKNGTPQETLDQHYLDYITSEYENNNQGQ